MQVKQKPCSCDDCQGKLNYIYKRDGREGYCKNGWLKKLSKAEPTQLKRSSLPRSQTPIKKRSDKRAKQELAYSALRKAFLQTHPRCQAHVDHNCLGKATECHHKQGRIGELLCDDTKFLAVCRNCHFFIENNREEAIDRGWSELRLAK